MLDAEVILKRR